MRLICLVVLSLVASLLALKCSQFNDAYLAVDHLLDKNITLIPTIVRLAFHDCLGETCDGCLNLNIRTNFGLADATIPLNAIYEKKGFYKKMSRADFWQLAAHVALVRGGLLQHCDSDDDEKCPFFHNQFYWGREDCSTSPNYDGNEDGGNPHGDFSELWRILHGDFGLSVEEIVTLLGAHALGGADRKNSGWILNWQKKSLVFDNQYYENMVTLPYSHVDIAHGQKPKPRKEFVFEDGHPPVMMFNTDMSLWKELEAIEDEDGSFTGYVKCPVKDDLKKIPQDVPNFHAKCEDADTAAQVEKYAQDVQEFFDDFPSVYQKMVWNGYKELSEPIPDDDDEECGYCIPEGAFCEDGFKLSGCCCDGLVCDDNECVDPHHH